MTLVEFLMARIADDEAHLVEIAQIDGTYGYEGMYIDRVRAECVAKRAIVSEFAEQVESFEVPWDTPNERLWPEFGGGYLRGLRDAVKYLAVVYADHVDYLDEWRPDAVDAR